MVRNYLITALRNFTRYKLYSFINIAGLTVGLTCAIFIILLLRDELSYDKWIPGTQDLYRVESTVNLPGQQSSIQNDIAFPVPDAMRAHISGVTAAAHLEPYPMTVATGNRQFVDQVDVVSPNFFQVIHIPLIAGSSATVFTQPESAVITETAARKYFGTELATGKTLRVGGLCEYGPELQDCVIRQTNVLVTGVMRDLPHNTQLSGDIFIPNTSAADPMSQGRKQDWLNSHGYGYVELSPGTDPEMVKKELLALTDRSVDLSKRINIRMPASQLITPRLTPFRDVHLSSDRYGGMTPGGSWAMVYGFAAIAALIVLAACFNFTNLATARALTRAREISVRKVMGARRSQLVVQFLGESVLISATSLVLAVALTEILLPTFDSMIGKHILANFLGDWQLSLALVAIAVFTGLAAGAYPALILSGFRPALAVRTSATGTGGSGVVRTILVVLQFSVSIGLGISALVVFQQISYAHKVDLGLNKDRIVVIDASSMTPNKSQSLVRALAADPSLKGAALSRDVPFSGSSGSNTVIDVPGEQSTSVIRLTGTGPDFFSLYGIKLLSGRALSWGDGDSDPDHSSLNVMINEAAAKRFGYTPDNAVGKRIFFHNIKMRVTIVGVTADFMFEGDRKVVVPTIYGFNPAGMKDISVKMPATRIAEALGVIDRTWHAFEPSIAINRHFLEADFEKQFLADEQQGKIFGLFVAIAIFIACLGLFGLAAFTTERRTKEIGIRKVFGARSADIVLLLLWQFSIPVLIANLIAWPISYYYLRHWLDGYAYRISLSPLYFAAAGTAALIIAWITVMVHAAHVASTNPVHALRYE